MQARSTGFPSEQLAQRWRVLTDQRRSYFIELYVTGRWKRYFSEAEFIIRMRDAIKAAEHWEKLATARSPGRPAS